MISYKRLIIFYFSGTGNAERIAEQIVDISKEKGLNSELYDIIKIDEDDFPEINSDTLIGFCSPTHGFNMPPIMLKFMGTFKKRETKNTKVFILNTRAGMKLYKLFTPGLSGIALILPAIILRLKGYNIVGYRPMDMPSNWISLHPGLRTSVVRSIDERCSRITEKFTEKILSGKRVLRGLLSLPVDLIISPVSVLYYFIGRFGLAKTFIATDKCNNCGLCIKQCPVNAISEINGINFWAFKCESCMKCMNSCPKRAIETAHGYTFLIWWLIFSVLTNIISNYLIKLSIFEGFISVIKESVIYNLVLIGMTFLVLFLSYKFLHFLMRYKIFNRIIAYTSLTHYKFWRRYALSKHLKSK